MTRGKRSGLAAIVITLALCTAAAGCGSDKDPEVDPTMTPDKAHAIMLRTAADVMAVVTPDEQPNVPPTKTPIPCGGVEGSDFSRIKYGVIVHSARAFDDADEAFRAAATKLKELGYDVDPAEPVGTTTTMNFNGDVGSGSLIWHGSGPLSLNVETECLKNPDRS
jgi:hypothetical protein